MNVLPLLPLVVAALCFVVGAHVAYLVARVSGTGLPAFYLLAGGAVACCLTKRLCHAIDKVHCSYRTKIVSIAFLTAVLGIALLRRL